MINPFAVILPSAGLGTRFGKEIPKQYQKIQGKLVINYSLELFLTFKECKKIVIAISNVDDFHHPLLEDNRIEIIQGGNSSCLLYTSPSPRDQRGYRMPSSA